MSLKKEKLDILLKKVGELGLRQYSIDMNTEFLEYNEYELCFDTIAEHLYEDKIIIDESTYQLMMLLITELKLSKDGYLYLKELLNEDS